MKLIDFNGDVGEGIGNDAAIMPFLSSCNIACGAHAGSLSEMEKIVNLALYHHVKIGAHPSYPDKENFGRKGMNMPAQQLVYTIKKQVGDLTSIVNAHGQKLHHIKLHGALYNDAARNEEVATAVLDAIDDKDIMLYAPYKSVLVILAKAKGFNLKLEGFADRAYSDDLQLVSRSFEGAVFHEKEKVLAQVLDMVVRSQVKTNTGKLRKIEAETICLHGDNLQAVEILQFLRDNLMVHGIKIA